jgi:hypothetical protein
MRDTLSRALVHGARHYFGPEPSAMSNSTMDDYFAFMSDKWASKDPATRNSMAAAPKKPLPQSDTIDFVDESQIEVIESVVSDTMIERIFKKFKQA